MPLHSLCTQGVECRQMWESTCTPCVVCVCACSFYDSLSTELQPETLKLISPTGSIHTPLWVWIHTHRRRKVSFTHSDVKSWNNVLAYCTVTTCWCMYVFVHMYTDTYKRAVYYNSCIQDTSWIMTITPSRCIPMGGNTSSLIKFTQGQAHTQTLSLPAWRSHWSQMLSGHDAMQRNRSPSLLRSALTLSNNLMGIQQAGKKTMSIKHIIPY